MIYSRFPSASCFLWCHILNSKCGTSIQYMNAPINYFRLETFWNATCCQKASHHIHNSVVLPLAYTILLGCISCCKLSLDSMVLTKICKFMWVIFSTVIRVKNFYWVANFFLNKCFIAFKSFKGFRFFLQKISPYLTNIIINEGNYISFTSIRMWYYWSTNFIMNKLQRLLHSPRFSLWELITMLFSNNTFFTKLRRSCNLRKPHHHVLLLQCFQSAKIQMPIAKVP